MRRGNVKQDWSKPFKMIFSKAQFQDLQTSDDTPQNVPLKQQGNIVKQQIITPQITIVRRVTDVKPFAKINPNYVRLSPHLNIPKINDYELSEVDHVFIQTHKEKYKLNGKIVLTVQFLKSVIIALETKQGKESSVPRSKANLVAYLQREFKDLSKMPNYQTFTDMLYNYWRNRREELKFPLFRPQWRPNQEQYNHLLAFKYRQKQKRSLRRSGRTSEQDILEQMANQLSTALKIAERVEMREQIKQKQVEVQLSLFHQQLKSVFAPPQFLGQQSLQNRTKDKQKIKKFSQDCQRIRKDRQVKSQQFKQPLPTVFDQKQSVVNFLATVVAEAELCGLNYQRLFHYKSEQAFIPVIPPSSPPREVQPLIEDEEYLNLSLRRAGQYLFRQFEEEQYSEDSSTLERQQIGNPIKREMQKQVYDDILDFKKNMVSRFYFGQDDQGDYQNLRKNIATNFKKFQTTKDGQ